MGAGKTTIGKQVQALTFGDSDHEIQRAPASISDRSSRYEGEEGFRQREQQAIDDPDPGRQPKLATGGGAILRAENRQHLSARGIVVFLACSPGTAPRHVP